MQADEYSCARRASPLLSYVHTRRWVGIGLHKKPAAGSCRPSPGGCQTPRWARPSLLRGTRRPDLRKPPRPRTEQTGRDAERKRDGLEAELEALRSELLALS